jgi:hypothetical protein
LSPTFLLDTNIVSNFLQAGREKELAVASQRVSLMIADEVRRELEGDRQRGARAFTSWLAGSNISVRRIVLGSEAEATFAQLLHPKDPQKDLGERASIALADPSQPWSWSRTTRTGSGSPSARSGAAPLSSWESLRLSVCCSSEGR